MFSSPHPGGERSNEGQCHSPGSDGPGLLTFGSPDLLRWSFQSRQTSQDVTLGCGHMISGHTLGLPSVFLECVWLEKQMHVFLQGEFGINLRKEKKKNLMGEQS